MAERLIATKDSLAKGIGYWNSLDQSIRRDIFSTLVFWNNDTPRFPFWFETIEKPFCIVAAFMSEWTVKLILEAKSGEIDPRRVEVIGREQPIRLNSMIKASDRRGYKFFGFDTPEEHKVIIVGLINNWIIPDDCLSNEDVYLVHSGKDFK